MPLRLGVCMSHPTQYHSPWFRELASLPELDLEVLYCFRPDATQQGEGFGVPFEWDVSLLEGYRSRFLMNISRRPGFQFTGCDTPEISDVIASAEYDAFLINGWQVKSYWQAMHACWKRKLPMMIRGDSNLLDKRSLHVRAAKRLTLGRWIPRFAAYLTVGVLNAQYYEHYGADASRFFPVRHFVDNHWFAGGAARARLRLPQLRTRWGIPADGFVVLFAGKFLAKKRPMDVIHAVEQRTRMGDRIHLLMVGDGPLRAQCEGYALERGLPVSFTGFLNQHLMPDAYACADVLVLPSSYGETWGLVVNEAMACGVSAIVTDKVGCAPDLIVEDETGNVYPAGQVAELAKALGEYTTSRGLAVKRGQRAMKHIAGYNIASAASNTLAAAVNIARSPL